MMPMVQNDLEFERLYLALVSPVDREQAKQRPDDRVPLHFQLCFHGVRQLQVGVEVSFVLRHCLPHPKDNATHFPRTSLSIFHR